ncbi:MAG: PKD domain-containing protein [Bacteroidia bacterium]|nr:PKD domain-containing protein [Bacteroidia bacterium]
MIRARQFLLLFSLLVLTGPWAKAQLTLSDTLSKTEMLQTLFGNGVYISNLNYQFCDTTNAMREFDATNTNLALGRGVLLSTGEADDAAPTGLAACISQASTSLGMPGYTPLNSLLPPGFSTNDACRISFDIVALCDTIAIKYVFASEEYPVFVNSSFNDVFAFWISGPGYGPAPGTNISVIPGTATPVTINNINNGSSAACTPPTGPCTNCGYYINNASGTTVSYNAWTKPLLAEATVIPCSTYTVTIAIADAGDFILDSGVFLEAGGIGCSSPSLQLAATNSSVLGSNIAVEGCVNYGQFTFTLPTPLLDTTVFHYQISGTATPGIDYVPFPDSIIMPAGQTSVTLPVYIFDDQINEGSEFIQIYYVDSALCGTFVYQDTAIMEILDKPLMPDVGDVSLCPGQTVTVPVTGSSSPGMTFQWSPTGGLGSTTTPNTTVTLPNAATSQFTKDFILTTTDLQGYCINKDTITATVYPKIEVDFVADTVCFGNPTTYQDFTITDSVVAYRWDLGDGTQSADSGPLHTFGTPGLYQTELVVENTKGCKDSITYAVRVHPLPVVNFTANDVCDGAPMLFQNAAQALTTYAWRFGDGSISTAQSPNHVFPSHGTYTVTVVATTAEGCQDSMSREVKVYQNPVSSFTFEEACDNEEILFFEEATAGTGRTLSFGWQFGDGSNGNLPDPSHLYASAGFKQVRLTITDENGCTDDSLQSVEVYPLPVADFRVDAICAKEQPEFINLSSVANGKEITKYFWDLGYNNQISRLETPALAYGDAGTFQIFLRTETENGCLDSITKSLDIYPLPSPLFKVTDECVFDEVTAINLSTIDTTLFGDVIRDLRWDWGDGSFDIGSDTILHIYQTSGTFDVTLLVTSERGCEHFLQREATIFPLPADPIILPDTVCFGEPGFLMATAPSNVTVNWYYNENDPTPFQQSYSYVTPPNTFPTIYYVEPLSDFGCYGRRIPIFTSIFDEQSGRIETNSTIVEIPVALVNFSVSGSLRPKAYRWNFGDGQSSESPTPSHEYQYPGMYQVEVTVVDENGCEFLFREYIEVKELIAIHVPSAFTPNDDGYNDELFLGWSLVHDLKFQLFNRWGQKVFESDNPNFRWNGVDPQGTPVPEGVYVFYVKAIDIQGRPIEKRGTITILR